MATPTEQVTRNAQEYLADDVILAMRVDWGPDAVSSRMKLGSGFWARAYLWSPIALPIMALLRRPDRRKMRDDPTTGSGILALTADGGRILLSTSPPRRKRPTGVVEVLPHAAALQVDVDLMETDLIPTLTVAHRQFVVNGIDFRALLKAVENLTVRSPEIRAALPRLQAVGNSPYTGAPGAG
jgi:hypothetical protein